MMSLMYNPKCNSVFFYVPKDYTVGPISDYPDDTQESRLHSFIVKNGIFEEEEEEEILI